MIKRDPKYITMPRGGPPEFLGAAQKRSLQNAMPFTDRDIDLILGAFQASRARRPVNGRAQRPAASMAKRPLLPAPRRLLRSALFGICSIRALFLTAGRGGWLHGFQQ